MRILRALPVAVALALAVPSASASAATAHVVDPAGDVGYSFEAQADVTAADVRWDDATLTVAITYAAPPPSTDLSLLVSSAAEEEDEPGTLACDSEVLEAFQIRARDGGATLTVADVEGALTAQGVWSGTTITYTFSAPALVRAWTTDRVDPFACLEGTSGDDRFFGAFDGKILKLTPEAMAAAVVAEAHRRYGAGRDSWARCPRQGISGEYTDADGLPRPATAFCAFEHRSGTALRSGSTSVYLASGVPRFLRFTAIRLPAAYRSCGAYDGHWRKPPIFGAGMQVWARKVPCAAARRVALRGFGGSRVGAYRCRVLQRGEEYVKVRCTRPGGRVVRWEGGA
jgi:hypothetical protein